MYFPRKCVDKFSTALFLKSVGFDGEWHLLMHFLKITQDRKWLIEIAENLIRLFTIGSSKKSVKEISAESAYMMLTSRPLYAFTLEELPSIVQCYANAGIRDAFLFNEIETYIVLAIEKGKSILRSVLKFAWRLLSR